MYTEYLLHLKLSLAFTNLQLLRVAKFIATEHYLPKPTEVLTIAKIKSAKQQQVLTALQAKALVQKVALHKAKTNYLSILDHQYPQRLKESYNPPAVLFYRGDLTCLQQTCLGIVGARDCTKYATISIKKLLAPFPNDISIISGLAMGVDRVAHQIALSQGLKTVAVVGNGLDYVYPRQNATLQQNIIDQGLLISEYPLGMAPKPYHFPARNRIIAGLTHGLLVAEAKAKSGSLITANLALENNRTVFAIPGSIFSPLSKGTNRLIQVGATPVEQAEDILNELTYYG